MDELFTPSGDRPTRSVALDDRPVRSPGPATAAAPATRRHVSPQAPAGPAQRRAGSRAPRRGTRPGGVAQARRVIVAVLIGAATMLGVATMDTVAGATVPVLGSFASLPSAGGSAAAKAEEIPPPPADPGVCLSWTRADAADTAVVDCAQPHLFEQAGTVQLTDQATLPDDSRWRALVAERCTPVVLQYLGGKFDPNGKFRVGALKPSQKKWDEGTRELRCGLQSASKSGALYPLSGRAANQDQAGVHDPGTCLGIDGPKIADPVDCTAPHAVEAVGIVDLSTKFPDAFPPVEEQDKFLQPECTRIAGEYAGGEKVIADKKLTVYWDNVTEKSWDAGTRKVNCNLGALLPDRSGFAPVTGSVRGDVSVSDQPAPAATTTPKPGVPAPATTTAAPNSQPAGSTAPTPADPSSGPSSGAPSASVPVSVPAVPSASAPAQPGA